MEININKPLVSIIMNCYNSSLYLKEALDSVLNQTYNNWEIIFWDNQSSDKSAIIFKDYVDSRFKYFYAPTHTNLGEARKLAVQNSKGSWIAFLDCDDYWELTKLEKQIGIVNTKNNVGVIYGGSVVKFEKNSNSPFTWNPDMSSKFPLLSGNINFELANQNFIPFLTVLISKKAYDESKGFSSKYKQAEDFEILMKIADLGYKFEAVQEDIAYYRVHADQNTNSQYDLTFTETIDILKNINKIKYYNIIKLFEFNYIIYSIKKYGFVVNTMKLILDYGILSFLYKSLVKIINKIF